MYKDIYKSGMSKIKAGEDFYTKMDASLSKSSRQKNKIRLVRLVPVFTVLMVLVFTSIVIAPSLLDRLYIGNNQDNKHIEDNKDDLNEFKIIKEIIKEINDSEGCEYVSIVYIDSYGYSPSEWLGYARSSYRNDGIDSIKGEKLGEVILDLKGKKYTGTPPDFSSTRDVGTEIYSIKNVKKESAILVVLKDVYSIYYRTNKHISKITDPLSLQLSDVFGMVSDKPEIIAVELRDEQNGAWMNTTYDQSLLSFLNDELPSKALLNYGELSEGPYNSGYRIPINLLFADGTALNFQLYPSTGMVSVFGGFVPVSEELNAAMVNFYKQGGSYPCLSDLLPYEEDDIEYLQFDNHLSGDSILCKEPQWSRSELFSILYYYRVEETELTDKSPAVTAVLGRSIDDSISMRFYKTEGNKAIVEINGAMYKPVKGYFPFDDIVNYLENYTG